MSIGTIFLKWVNEMKNNRFLPVWLTTFPTKLSKLPLTQPGKLKSVVIDCCLFINNLDNHSQEGVVVTFGNRDQKLPRSSVVGIHGTQLQAEEGRKGKTNFPLTWNHETTLGGFLCIEVNLLIFCGQHFTLAPWCGLLNIVAKRFFEWRVSEPTSNTIVYDLHGLRWRTSQGRCPARTSHKWFSWLHKAPGCAAATWSRFVISWTISHQLCVFTCTNGP